MCKIVIIPNASKMPAFEHFARYMADCLSDQPDGYGYAAQGVKGTFGTRTLHPKAYSKTLTSPSFVKSFHTDFGTPSVVTGAAMFHGRISTNTRDLLNTHPIERLDAANDKPWHLIHNGVVTHHGEKYKMNTKNDSEDVLYNLMTGGIDKVAKNLTGYYAAGAFDPDGNLHVFRDELANLQWAHSKLLGSDIFATTDALIQDVALFLDEKLVSVPLKDNIYLMYNKDGALIVNKHFESRGWDKHSASLSGRSLGRNISTIGFGMARTSKGNTNMGNDQGATKASEKLADVEFPHGDEFGHIDPWSMEFLTGMSLASDDAPDQEIETEKYKGIFDDTELKEAGDVEDDFLLEIEYMDESYEIWEGQRQIAIEEFYALSLKEMTECVIRRHDGTIVEPFKKVS